MAAPGAIRSPTRIKLTAFIKDQIAQGNIEWDSQEKLIKAALGPDARNDGTAKRVIDQFKNQLTFGTGNDTQLFKTFIKEYGGSGGGKWADPEIKGRVEWGAEWDPKEAYRAAVAKNQMFGGTKRNKYSLPEGAEDEFAEFYEDCQRIKL